MADKQIVELPQLLTVTDETQIPVYQPGAANAAQRMSGKQFKEFGESAVATHVQRAVNAAAASQSAYEGVKSALDNLPEGDTLIINDLTTGGASAALSAEMGKTLNSGKVNKAGDTMTGDLFVNGGYGRIAYGNGACQIESRTTVGSTSNRRVLSVGDSSARTTANAVMLSDVDANGKIKSYSVLHTGNKPSGSYTGNGDATERTIDTGGIGTAVEIHSSKGSAIVTAVNGLCFSSSSTEVLSSAYSKMVNGVITLATDNTRLNASGVTYYYQVL